jgi:HlyD family secretion protein
MTWRRTIVACVLATAVIGALAASRSTALMPDRDPSVPTARVVKGTLELTVYANGELRAGRSATLVAPPAGGTLRIVKLLPTGTAVKAGDAVVELDPADQQYALEQAKSQVAEAEQQIVKTKADAAVQAAQDKVDLLTAQYDVRRAELDTAANDLISAIDAKKNVLTLEEARRHLTQLQQDASSRTATNAAALAVLVEQRHKAELATERAQSIIDSLVLKAPFDGLVVAKENRDAAGNFFFQGMVLPEYRQGDTTSSGRAIADVIEGGQMQIRARIDETDRENLQPGQTAVVQSDELPGETFTAKVGSLGALASRADFFEGTSALRQFDVTFTIDHPDPRLRAGSSVRLVVSGRKVPGVLLVPRQSVFQKAGKTFVYVQEHGGSFERRDVKVINSTESRAAVSGVADGDVIALVDPAVAAARKTRSTSGPIPGAGGGA